MRHILSYAQQLKNKLGEVLDEEIHHHLTTVLDSANRMEQLFADLLTFSRASQSKCELRVIGLTKLVQEALQDLQSEIGSRNIVWKIEMEGSVLGDRSLLRQVIINLLSNALKFTSKQANPVIQIGSSIHEGEAVIFVKDNGVGFDPGYADKLFKVFSRLHSQEEFEGTGVGLALVEKIITRHGGRVWRMVSLTAEPLFSFPCLKRPLRGKHFFLHDHRYSDSMNYGRVREKLTNTPSPEY